MAESRSAGIPPEEVERRLRELGQLHELGMALRDVRFVDPKLGDRVRERPYSEGEGRSRGEHDRRGS